MLRLDKIFFAFHYWVLKNRKVVSYLLIRMSSILRIISNYSADKILLKGLRLYPSATGISLLKRFIGSLTENLDDLVSRSDGVASGSQRVIILSWPKINGCPKKKGVLLVSFTTTFSMFYRDVNVDKLSEYFYIVLEPSSSGYADPDILFWPLICGSEIYIQATEVEDRVFLESLGLNFVPLTIGASNWVSTNEFDIIDVDKKYDSIYIANTNPVKRVDRYLSAVANIKKIKPEYSAALICADWGEGRKYIERMVAKYGLADEIDLFFSLSKQDIVRCLNMAKSNVLLSLKEGSNRSLFESMSCNTPVVCISENVGVNKEYINQYTGKLVYDRFLEDALIEISRDYAKYSPRKWVLENISPERSTELLEDIIPDQKNIFVKVNNPEVSYKNLPEVDHAKYSHQLLRLFSKEDLSYKDAIEGIGKLKSQFYDDVEG